MLERVSRRGKRKVTPAEIFYSTEFPNDYDQPEKNDESQ